MPKRLPYFSPALLQAIKRDVHRSGVYTKDRASTILSSMVGANLHIHNGKEFVPVIVREQMVGMKVGQLVGTKQPFYYKPSNANKKAPTAK